jgi:hypothetical protein
MGRRRTLAIPLGAAGAAVIVERHGRGAASGRSEPGGVLMGDAVGYDALSRLILGSFYRSIAADVAQAAPNGARVLEVGCGPGHLSTRLARQHGLDMTIPLGPRPPVRDVRSSGSPSSGSRSLCATSGTSTRCDASGTRSFSRVDRNTDPSPTRSGHRVERCDGWVARSSVRNAWHVKQGWRASLPDNLLRNPGP